MLYLLGFDENRKFAMANQSAAHSEVMCAHFTSLPSGSDSDSRRNDKNSAIKQWVL